MYDEAPEEFLLDTNVISETVVKRPNAQVMEWLDVWGIAQTYISAMSIGEIRKGIDGMEHSKRRTMLEYWVSNDLRESYKGRILPIDTVITNQWGKIMAEYKNHDGIDMIFAATALVHNMTLVTRNEKHFNIHSLRVMNPWKM